MPQWFIDLTDEVRNQHLTYKVLTLASIRQVCRACEVPERPNSCNANLYEVCRMMLQRHMSFRVHTSLVPEDGGDSVGWHADDEQLGVVA